MLAASFQTCRWVRGSTASSFTLTHSSERLDDTGRCSSACLSYCPEWPLVKGAFWNGAPQVKDSWSADFQSAARRVSPCIRTSPQFLSLQRASLLATPSVNHSTLCADDLLRTEVPRSYEASMARHAATPAP